MRFFWSFRFLWNFVLRFIIFAHWYLEFLYLVPGRKQISRPSFLPFICFRFLLRFRTRFKHFVRFIFILLLSFLYYSFRFCLLLLFVQTAMLFSLSVVAFLRHPVDLVCLNFHYLLFFRFEEIFKLEAFHGGLAFLVPFVNAFFLGDADDEVFEVLIFEGAIGLQLGLFFVQAIKDPVILFFLELFEFLLLAGRLQTIQMRCPHRRICRIRKW